MRQFHWLLVASVALAFLSSEEESACSAGHIPACWAPAVLIAFRLVWGSVGGEHARFANLIHPSRMERHVRGLFAGRVHASICHYPLGGIAVLGLLRPLGESMRPALQGVDVTYDDEVAARIRRGRATALLTGQGGTRASSRHPIPRWRPTGYAARDRPAYRRPLSRRLGAGRGIRPGRCSAVPWGCARPGPGPRQGGGIRGWRTSRICRRPSPDSCASSSTPSCSGAIAYAPAPGICSILC